MLCLKVKMTRNNNWTTISGWYLYFWWLPCGNPTELWKMARFQVNYRLRWLFSMACLISGGYIPTIWLTSSRAQYWAEGNGVHILATSKHPSFSDQQAPSPKSNLFPFLHSHKLKGIFIISMNSIHWNIKKKRRVAYSIPFCFQLHPDRMFHLIAVLVGAVTSGCVTIVISVIYPNLWTPWYIRYLYPWKSP